MVKFLSVLVAVMLMLISNSMAQSAQSLYFEQGGDIVQVDCTPREPDLASVWKQRCGEIELALMRFYFVRLVRGTNDWAALERDKGPAGCSVLFMPATTTGGIINPVYCQGDNARRSALKAKLDAVIHGQ